MSVERAKNVPPFVLWCTAMIPTAFDDSMSYYEALCALYKFIQDNLVEPINNNATVLDKAVKDMAELKSYVDNYFENLDVQEEINNKLDEMAEGGQLATIIAQFLAAAPVFAYGTIAEMAAATNLTDGCIARVLGNTSAADGDGAYYKVRTKESGETGDGVNKVEIGATLIADRIIDSAVNSLQTAVSELQNQMESVYQDELIVFGDSWSDLNVSGNVWSINAAAMLNCTLRNLAVNGAGFIAPSNNLIGTQITSYLNNNDYDKTKAKYIVVLGGVNDYNNSVAWTTLINTIETNLETLKNSCPQAKILYVNNYNWPMTNAQSVYWINVFSRLSTMVSGSAYLFNQDGLYGKSMMNETLYHLTVFGQELMANNICAKLTGGDITTYYQRTIFENSDVVAYVMAEKYYDMIIYTLYGTWKTTSQQTTINKVSPWADASGVSRGSVGVGYSDFVYDLSGTYLSLARQGNTANESFITSFAAPLITEKSAV